MAAIVFVRVLDWSHTVYRGTVVELDPLAHVIGRPLTVVLLENALRRAGVRVCVGRHLQRRVAPLVCDGVLRSWADG